METIYRDILILSYEPRLERKQLSWVVYFEVIPSQFLSRKQLLYVKETTKFFDDQPNIERSTQINTERYWQLMDDAQAIQIPALVNVSKGIMLHVEKYELEILDVGSGHSVYLQWNSIKPEKWGSLTKWHHQMMDFLTNSFDDT